MKSIEQQITKEIQRTGEETIFFTEDFMQHGTPDAVRIALFRLVNKNIITRLARGVYAKPGYSRLLNKETVPGVEAIVKAIAQRDRAKIIPTGVYALNALGLSTQVPMNFVFLTDGTPRKLKIGKATITFKRTVPKNLSYKNELCMLVVQALKEIGNGKVTEQEKEKVIKLLKQVDYKELKHDIALAPQWIAEIMAKAIP
ncbi:MAG: type IV toxin-antitoxin system AbiEi family antitoxin domain-containing protein [Mariniphaga sp.]|jgi:hypothetical protein|nr:type IV toxin-antitoxin system AbiEi family antitoxin domain-containing protein [Mariniphaga sp.]